MIRVDHVASDLALVTLDRPEKRNALTLELIQRLTHQLHILAQNTAVRGILLAGAGPSFCTGVDLHAFANATPQTIEVLIHALRALCAAVRTHPKPIACMIQGYCLGGALEVAACCDFRVCTPDAQLGMPEVTVGIPSVIDAVMLGHIIGTGRARELLLTGDAISGETAYAWGLATRLASSAELQHATIRVLSRVTRHDPAVIAEQKHLHQQWLDVAYESAVNQSVSALVDAFQTGRPQRIADDRLKK